jgi:hypothetical protein
VSDSINMREMHSYPDWERFARRRNYEWFQPIMEPEWVAWWIEILKQSEDVPDLFPHGKWASIQRLQAKLSVVAAGERFALNRETHQLA